VSDSRHVAATRLRVLVHAPAEAAWNMAVDEALLLVGGQPTLRFYGWSPHAVSLGYFQCFEQFDDVAATTPVVRRLTGGGAIHHGDELTFSLTIDGGALPRSVGDSYRLLHDAIVLALGKAGVESRVIGCGAPPSARPTERWCFAEPGRFDVVTAHGKLLGSAQRRIHGPGERVLHHGSIVLQRPAWTPFVAAIHDEIEPPAPDVLIADITSALADALRLTADQGELHAAERQLADRLQHERYRTRAWNERR
jgi:lipoate-protein ligase A